MKALGGIIAVVVVIALVVGMFMVSTYNGLVKMDQDVKGKWAQVENQLKRRTDLIPNLVATVKGFAAQEKSVIDSVTSARAKLAGATTPAAASAANGELTTALSRLLVVVENYPQIKSDQTFRDLMFELSGTENRIAVARKDYNDSVQTFNTRVRTFPTNMVAGMLGFSAAEFFEVTEADKELPKVDFSTTPATSTP
ncbi:MAG: LemA family protein [Coriobacteriaceae bacterium]|nr:LemA family protein [Coriobacteriaceae bacterium]